MDTAIIEVKPELPEIIELKPVNEKFVRLYLSGMNGTQAYLKAKGWNANDSNKYLVASACSSRLLANAKVCQRIRQLMDLSGFNEDGADKELNFLMSQHNDLKTKLGAIKHFNELKKRAGAKNVFQGNTFNLANILQKANE